MINRPSADSLDQSINLGIDYLYEHQYPNGEFCTYYAPDINMQEWCVPDSTVFPTSIIAGTLLGLRTLPKVREMLSSTTGFLRYQIMRGSVWNHFTKWHPLFTYEPPDVDNSVCASYVLKTLEVDFPENRKLILSNRNKEGLFYTWFVLHGLKVSRINLHIVAREFKRPFKSIAFWFKNSGKRDDIDAVVNANALFYLGLSDETFPVVSYLINVIQENRELSCDKWYHNIFIIYYFITRNYATVPGLEPVKEPIISRILATGHSDGSFGDSAMDTATALISLLNLNYRDEKLHLTADYLINTQHESGCWNRSIFFYSGANKDVGWGSEELTTGFCTEALAKYKEELIVMQS